MGELHVTVSYHGAVIEDCFVPVRGAVRLGESDDALVGFPGADLTVYRVGDHYELNGERLGPGERTDFVSGAVLVQLEHVERLRLPRVVRGHFDARFLLIAMAVTASGMWLDTLTSVAEHPAGGFIAEQYDRVRSELPGGVDDRRTRRTTSVQPNAELYMLPPTRDHLVDGPPARQDDSLTGFSYYPWYRSVVPSSRDSNSARTRLSAHPDDATLHAVIARDAYQTEKWEGAHHHYQWLTKEDEATPGWLLGLALSRKRLGMHRAELDTYERLLLQDPDNFLALGNRAVSLARQDRWSEVPGALSRMYRAAPDHPYAHVFEGTCAALQGREDEAIAHLEIAVSERGLMSDDMQIELRRDIALDPALGPLRADPRLRAMLSRQLGAAGPRPSY